jgi:uncharacterized protein YwqG
MCDEFESCLLDFEHIWSVPVDTSVLQDAGEWCRFAERFSPSFPISKVWGLPDVLQEATEVCCERVSHGVSCWDEPQPTLEDVEAARRDWRLLLQVASEPSAGMRWGSGSGRLFFQVRERDASIGDFDRVLGLMQDT